MFTDKVNISVKSGKGGDGCVSFHRAKYLPNGGPDGGDGGKGGSIIFESTSNMSSLIDYRYKKLFAAMPGENGRGRNCSGKNGDDIIIKVPVGTIIREQNTGAVMADMSKDGQMITLVDGGRGGKGNQHFATPVRQAPRFAQTGSDTKKYNLILELKLIADVSLVGLPNVGKSSILKMATSANPKIANYHFTTLNPNLGVVRNRYSQDFLLADIPGLIEGSSRGLGLGLKFLRHIERTRLIVHVVDMAELGGMSSIDAIKKIEHELTSYNPALKDRIGVVVANKMDLPGAQENYKKLDEYYKGKSIKLCPVSAVTNTGLDAFLDTVFLKLQNCEPIKVFDSTYVEEIIDDHDKYTIKLIKKGYYELEGYGIKKMIGYTNIDTEKGFAFFQNYFRDKGIITALKDKGIQKGDTVSLYGLEFEYLD